MGILITQNNDVPEIEDNKPVENKYQESELIVFDFTEKESDQDIKVSFDIYNNSNETIENMSLFLDYYENNKNIYTHEFDIDNLKPGEKLKITDESIVFIYDKITSHQFQFSMKKVPETNLKDYLNKFGRIDFNLYKIS